MENVGLQWESEISFEPFPLHAVREKEGDHVGSGRDVNRLYRAVGSFQTRPAVQTLLQLTSGDSFNPNLFCSVVLCLVGTLLLVFLFFHFYSLVLISFHRHCWNTAN